LAAQQGSTGAKVWWFEFSTKSSLECIDELRLGRRRRLLLSTSWLSARFSVKLGDDGGGNRRKSPARYGEPGCPTDNADLRLRDEE
jgi:hypothetical protein